ncbi:hypothetical protein KJ763_02680 [Patescibacteria group bacterium]|nr:hypothetical protein [Patescibacteria group bacterium]
MKKYIFIIIILAVIIIAVLGYQWYETKMRKIGFGLAEPNFPYRNYTQEELNIMYPQIKYADVATRVTPEETYAKFRQALSENNLEMAIEQLSKESEKYEENVNDLTQAHKENRFNEIYQSYPEIILKENISEALSQFYFNYKENNQQRTHFINFIKNSDGDWKLDSL